MDIEFIGGPRDGQFLELTGATDNLPDEFYVPIYEEPVRDQRTTKDPQVLDHPVHTYRLRHYDDGTPLYTHIA